MEVKPMDQCLESKSGSLTDLRDLLKFSSDHGAMDEDKNLYEVEVVEKCPKKATASEVRSAN